MGRNDLEIEPGQSLGEVLASDAAVYFWKGRVALYALLKAMNIGEDDEVLVPAFTCVVVPEAVMFAGATPVYVDIDRESLNLDPDQLQHLITSRTKAVIVQHTFGLAADLDAVRRVIAGRNIQLIEDCAHTMSTLFRGRPVGTFGDGAFFSSQWTKPVTTGLGGIALARDPEVHARLKQFERAFNEPRARDVVTLRLQLAVHSALFRPSLYWLSRDLLHLLTRAGVFLGSSTDEELSGDKPERYELSMSRFQRRHLRRLLQGLDNYALHRTFVQEQYSTRVPRVGFRRFFVLPETTPVMLRYPVAVSNKAAVLEAARRDHVEIGEWFLSPVHPVTDPVAMKHLGYSRGRCPNAEWACEHVINLPTHNRVTGATISKTCAFLAKNARPDWQADADVRARTAFTDVA